MSGLHLSPAPPTDDQRSERAESELAARGLGQAPGGAVHVTELFQAPRREGNRVLLDGSLPICKVLSLKLRMVCGFHSQALAP